MAQPVWITPAGNLGVIPEGVFYQTAMLADTATIDTATCTATSATTDRITCNSTADIWPGLNVMFSGTVFGGVDIYTRYFVLEVINDTQFTIAAAERDTSPIALTTASGSMTATFNQHVYFYLQAGQLPPGIQVSDNGLIVGIPKAMASIQGVPYDVSADVTSKFTIRAYTQKPLNNTYVVDRIAERTFSLTVTGQDAPEFITPAGQIATYYDGSLVNGLQIEYTDTDPADNVTIRLVAGTLPPGLSINNKGLISGFVEPAAPIDATAGYSRDGQGYSEYSFDFITQSVNTNYEFVLEVTDGKANNLRTFFIEVYSRNSLTADTTQFTADDTFITADVTPVRPPILLTPEGSIGTTRSDNFFAFKFDGIDLDGDQFEYVIDQQDSSIELLDLRLDRNTGWLYGYIPDLGLTEQTVDFSIRLFKKDNPSVFSQNYDFSITVIGFIDQNITWLTPSNLGTIDNGSTSTLYVAAVNASGISLSYRLESGSDSSLPQGLTLLPSGAIAGRVSFDTFALDGGTTTFDVTNNDLAITGEVTETTFDMKHSFTVEAYGGGGSISVFKDFSITVNRAYNQPYDNLYIQAMPPENDRSLVTNLLQNQDIIPSDLLYRPDDPNFGRAQQVVYWHAYGLTASTYADYVSSLYENHYWKNLVLGKIETAQALDDAGNVIYEVVYSRVVDDLVNSAGESVSKQVLLPYTVDDDVNVVYPNSLPNMRDQVIDTVGQISNILPRWMLSKQANGRVLGFTPAWVIAYTKPGKSGQVAYNINTQFNNQLNVVDFKVDRYELDKLLSRNWDPVTDHWIPTPPQATTFDINPHYQLPEPNDSSFVFVGGTGYAVGDRILIEGSQVGGEDDANDIIITVVTVDGSGTIETATAVGTAPLLTVGDVYYNVSGTNITGTGTGATWDIITVGEDPTIFDGNSLQFISPVDNYSNSTAYDKYLVFPKRTILG